MILKICLEITTLRYIFIHPFILFFCSSLFMFCLQCFGSEYWVFCGIVYLFIGERIPSCPHFPVVPLCKNILFTLCGLISCIPSSS